MEFRLVFSKEEILALDHYFTNRAGWIGHEDPADEAAHALANIISEIAEEIKKEDANDSNR
jgi:hypothetical protein